MLDASSLVVDLHALESADPEARERSDQALRRALGDYGLVFVQGHDVDMGALHALYDLWVQLSELPEARKRAWAHPEIWFQRGWTPANTERAVIAGGQPDFKECYFAAPMPIDPKAQRYFPEICADNVWPDEPSLAAFERAYMAIGRAVHEVGLKLLRGCARALGLESEAFTSLSAGAPHVSRLLRYLPLTDAHGPEILWGEEHTDFNLLTVLPGGQFYDPQGARCAKPDPDAGLYLRARSTDAHPEGEMLQGAAPAGCMVAQVGQQLEILSAGRYLATPHVVRPPAQRGFTRTAFAHFIHCHSETRLLPLDPFASDEAAEAYGPPVLAGTYGLKTLVDIGLAPKEALAKLGFRHYSRLERGRRVS